MSCPYFSDVIFDLLTVNIDYLDNVLEDLKTAEIQRDALGYVSLIETYKIQD